MATAMEVALVDQVHHYLNTHVYDNALFLAERLVAHHPSEENALLLATCYFRKGQAAQAAAILSGATRAENRYLLACCCFQLNQLIETENALLGGENFHVDDLDTMKNVPAGSAGLYLLGRVCRRGNRRQQAVACFVKSLEMDPFMWSAYEELCELGSNLEASQFFSVDHADEENNTSSGCTMQSRRFFGNEGDNNAEDRLADAQEFPLHLGLVTSKSSLLSGLNTSKPLDCTTPKTEGDSSKSAYSTTVVKKPRVEDIKTPTQLRKAYRRPLVDSDENFQVNARLAFSPADFDESPLNTPKLSQGSSTPSFPIQRTYQDKTLAAGSTRDVESSNTVDGRRDLLRLLGSFGSIYHKMSMYLCQEALDMLELLPASQRSSGWAQQQFGRAYFEMANYVQAQEVFCDLYKVEPHRMEGLDLYSTTLWHLKKEVELSYLAQQATDFDKLSCEAWCVAGNCFSLQKEHDIALTFFQRAIQLDSSFTYAYTLSGHEYVANENFEKAVNCYRHAIRTDSRHYNAWYGLGTIFYRQEKFEFAEYHFKRALEINPKSSLLHCFLGMVHHATHRYDEALTTLALAADLQPLNPQARFQRANVLITLQRYHEALKELHVVKNFAPRESSVYFMMGKVAKKLGRIEEAMKYFTLALQFHPKDNNQIKAAIDKINESDLDDDQM